MPGAAAHHRCQQRTECRGCVLLEDGSVLAQPRNVCRQKRSTMFVFPYQPHLDRLPSCQLGATVKGSEDLEVGVGHRRDPLTAFLNFEFVDPHDLVATTVPTRR